MSLHCYSRPVYKITSDDSYLYHNDGKWVIASKETYDGGLATSGILRTGETHSECPPTESGFWSGEGTPVLAAVGDEDFCLPYVDGVCLENQLRHDIPSLVSGAKFMADNTVDRQTKFAKIILGAQATVKVKNTVNEVNLVDREGQLVKNDQETVSISGDKTFSSAISAGAVKVNSISTDHDGADFTKSYTVTDFLSNKNDATISSLKTLTGSVTMKDLTFVGSEAKINNIKVAPITNCWIDTQASGEVVINKKVDFANINTGDLDISTPSQGRPSDCNN